MADAFLQRVIALRCQEQLDSVDTCAVNAMNRENGRLGGRPATLTGALLAAIARDGSGTALGLSRELRHSRKAIGTTLHRLVGEGRLRKVGYGVFALPERAS